MTDFQIHTLETAPEASKPLLENAVKSYGMVPNLIGLFAESPELLEAYQEIARLFSSTSLSAVEQNVVWLAINVEHECHYCVPAHTFIAQQAGVDEPTIKALREATPIPDPKLEALRSFTLKVVRNRGNVADQDVEAFLAAGFTKRNILDVLLGVAHKTISNYTNHLAKTPVDAPFQAFAWDAPANAAAA